MHVFFHSFIIEVDTSTDCHLLCEPIGRAACLADLDYVQPKYLVDKSDSSLATALSTLPAIIKPDDTPDDLPTLVSHWPKRPPSPVLLPIDMSLLPPSTYTKSLKDLEHEELIQWLYSVEHPVSPSPTDTKLRSSAPLECMEREEILTLLHHPNTSPPAIRPCDTPNASDTKSHWTAEELHRITGCRRFRNYRHLISTTKDGSFIDNGEFPLSIGSFTTIPKHRPHDIKIFRHCSSRHRFW